MTKDKIFVTKTFLPPLEEYVKYLEKVWDSRWLTNNGQLAQELEKKLSEYLGIKHVIFVSNGTIAIQLAIKALDIKKSVITTPFSFIATTSSILWENCKPIFVDIEPNTFCIDASKIEEAITKDTEAILAVHVYGYPCNVKEIEKIAKKHNLKVIYDGAHAFGVKIDGESVFKFGDISTLSLHATKLFHTGEGGLIVTNNDALAKKVILKDFGLEGERPIEVGINGKNSELHAAMGLANIKYLDAVKNSRKKIVERYKKLLSGTNLHNVKYFNNIEYNYAYFPVVFDTENDLLKAKKALEEQNIFARRYFYPSLNTLQFVEYIPCPNSEDIAERILCLPLYHDLPLETVKEITEIIKKTLEKTKPTLAVGIPAHNEERNIIGLIQSVLNQKSGNYSLKEIIVSSDASTDKTVSLVKELAKNDQRIKVIGSEIRKGKTYRLNELYSIHDSDFILTLDGDVILKDSDVIEIMINLFAEDKKTCMVAGHLVPVRPESFAGKIIYTNDILWDNVRSNINNGDHVANLYGAASMLKKDFSKSFSYPTNISCDEEFLYIKAKEKDGFRYAENARILFMPPATIREVVLQGRRALREREALVKILGADILKLHRIPLKYKVMESLKMLISDPFYTTLSLMLMVFLRVFPYEDNLNKKGMWQIANSTKKFNQQQN
jgi:dTDP-4-amino-4,6-dideoxygalactose transaminase